MCCLKTATVLRFPRTALGLPVTPKSCPGPANPKPPWAGPIHYVVALGRALAIRKAQETSQRRFRRRLRTRGGARENLTNLRARVPLGPRQAGRAGAALRAGVSGVRPSGHEASVTAPQLCGWGGTAAADDTYMKACGLMPIKLNYRAGRRPASAPGEQSADRHLRTVLWRPPPHQGGEAVFCWRAQASPASKGAGFPLDCREHPDAGPWPGRSRSTLSHGPGAVSGQLLSGPLG